MASSNPSASTTLPVLPQPPDDVASRHKGSIERKSESDDAAAAPGNNSGSSSTSSIPPVASLPPLSTDADNRDDTTSYDDIFETRASSMAIRSSTKISFKRYETTGYLDHGSFSQASVDTPLADDNRGMRLLLKMGWKKDTPLGKDGITGLVAPLQLVDANVGGEGLGKGREYDLTAEEATKGRRLLDVEVVETVELKEERAIKAAREETLKQELKAVVKEFYCDICNKQYAGVSDFAVHLDGYEHGHTKRLKETKEANRARAAGKGGSKAKQDQLRQEKEMQRRISAAAGKPGAAAPAVAAPPAGSGLPPPPPPPPPEAHTDPPSFAPYLQQQHHHHHHHHHHHQHNPYSRPPPPPPSPPVHGHLSYHSGPHASSASGFHQTQQQSHYPFQPSYHHLHNHPHQQQHQQLQQSHMHTNPYTNQHHYQGPPQDCHLSAASPPPPPPPPSVSPSLPPPLPPSAQAITLPPTQDRAPVKLSMSFGMAKAKKKTGR